MIKNLKKVYRFINKQFPFLFVIRFSANMYRTWFHKKNLVRTDAQQKQSPPFGLFSGQFLSHKGKSSQKWSQYLPIYDELIPELHAAFGSQIRVLEIGVQAGGSIEIWRKVFGRQATIYGIDIDHEVANLELDAHIRIGSVTNYKFLSGVAKELGSIDFVIDDGSHHSLQQRQALEVLFPYLSNNSVYVIEDIEHSYYWNKHGGYLRPGSIVQRMKRVIDVMNKNFFLFPVSRPLKMDFTNLYSLTFHTGVIIIRKREKILPYIIRTKPSE